MLHVVALNRTSFYFFLLYDFMAKNDIFLNILLINHCVYLNHKSGIKTFTNFNWGIIFEVICSDYFYYV